MGAEQSTAASATDAASSRVFAPTRSQTVADAIDPLDWQALAAEHTPSARVSAGGLLGTKLLVFGGQGDGEEHGDVWSLEDAKWQRLEPQGRACLLYTSPSPRDS